MAKKRLQLTDSKAGSYFVSVQQPELFSSGCALLDCSLGGGWAERILNLVGDKSSGKCIRNAWIALGGSGFVKIDDMGKDRPMGTSDLDVKLGLVNGLSVSTSHFWRECVTKTITITTRHGYSLEGTLDHRVLVWTPECDLVMRKLEDVVAGDIVCIAKRPQVDCADYVLPKLTDKRTMDYSSQNITVPPVTTIELAALLGLWLADGCVAGRNIVLSNNKSWFETILTQSLGSLGISKLRKRRDKRSKSVDFSIYSTRMFDFFNMLFDGQLSRLTARYKYVPDCIMQAPKHIQAAFLEALISCNSEYSTSGVSYYTASATLAEQVQLLLLNFGVIASRSSCAGPGKYHDHQYWTVAFYGPSAVEYLRQIPYHRGSPSPHKYRKSDFDSIPFLMDRMHEDVDNLRRNVGWSRNGKTKNMGRFPHFLFSVGNCTYKLLRDFVTMFQPFSKHMPGFAMYKELLSLDYHFDPVREVKINNNKVNVYDVHIPSGHRFWSNGFISHNTLLACEAGANYLRKYNDAVVWYRDVEAAFDVGYMTGMGIPADRFDYGGDCFCVEDVFEELTKRIAAKERGLYIVDSLDALSDRAEMKRGLEDGTYGVNKAKMLSQLFRRLNQGISSSHITVMVISQVRDNIGVTFGERHTRSGGRALDFYASQVVWLSQLKQIKRTVNGVERPVGIQVRARCKKNKIGPPFREAEFPLLFDYGVEDVVAGVEWLKTVKALNEVGITSDDLKALTSLRAIGNMDSAEYTKWRKQVSKGVHRVWRSIESEFVPVRRKY